MITIAEARHARSQRTRVAAWLDAVWHDDDVPPAFTWPSLGALPAWALDEPAALERLALLCGVLFAAPALRVCIDAGPLLRVRSLVGRSALERVLSVPGLPPVAAPWPADERGERDTLHAWGAAMLLTCIGDPLLRASLARVLSFPADEPPLMPLSAAARLVGIAHQILETPEGASPLPPEDVP